MKCWHCECEEIKEILLPKEHNYYSRFECSACGKLVKWGKKPRKENSMPDNNKITFMIGVPESKKMEIGFGTYEWEQLLHQYNKTFKEFCQMTKWFNDPSTDPAGKVQFVPVLKNMIETIYMQTKLLECAGAPDKIIADNLSLPF